jgi:hypothetical protein
MYYSPLPLVTSTISSADGMVHSQKTSHDPRRETGGDDVMEVQSEFNAVNPLGKRPYSDKGLT